MIKLIKRYIKDLDGNTVAEYNINANAAIATLVNENNHLSNLDFSNLDLQGLSIENCRFYDLRGSYATTILRNGVEIRDVADVLGHKDIETTENYYISSTDETRRNVTDSYENAINLDVIEDIIKYEIG